MLEPEEYKDCMEIMFVHNLHSLRRTNFIVSVMSIIFMLFPILVERDMGKAVIYLVVAAVAAVICVFSNIKYKQFYNGRSVNRPLIYILIIIFYANIMTFGIYLGVWSNPENFSVVFMIFLVCALFLYINPPFFNITLLLCVVAVFIASSFSMKDIYESTYDTVNVIIAGICSVVFTWYITMYRMKAQLNAIKLQDERNKYYNSSILDDLTQLKNRRDFMQTFQRYLASNRVTDKYLCLAILDLDFFKSYNDHYGHLKGDECLRLVGEALNKLRDSNGIYAARIGGEEFATLWFNENIEDAHNIITLIQQSVTNLNIPHDKSTVSDRLTISAGVYISQRGAVEDTQMIYNLADMALYEAKDKGRNCVVVKEDLGGAARTV